MQSSLLLALLLLVSVAYGFQFDASLVGWYLGHPTQSVIGPLTDTPVVWSVRQVGTFGDYLMEDYFTGQLEGSHQQFWVSTESIVYCGLLRHFMPGQDATVLEEFMYNPLLSNDNVTTWCAHATAGGCSLVKWTMTKVNATAFHMQVLLNPPSVHLDVVFVKQGDNPDAGYPVIPVADRKTCQLMSSARWDYIWNSQALPSDNIKGCPAAKLGAARATARESEIAATEVSSSQFCYRINNATDFIVQWNYSVDRLDMRFSAAAPADSWVAIGFHPQFPGMYQGRVLMGDAQCGVQQMIVEEWVGTPSPANWTNITGQSVTFSSGRTSVQASFPPPVPQSNHSMGETMWGFGTVGAECATPSYHSVNRGMFTMLDWNQPSISLPDWLKC